MTTHPLFRDDPYLQEATGTVAAHTPEGGLVLDQSVFYPLGGGQPGDSGVITWDGGSLVVASTVKGADGAIVLVPADPGPLPPMGAEVHQRLDWDRRYRHMRMHTALHLLSVVLPFGVTGGSVAADRGRLDFDMPDAPGDKSAIEAELNHLVDLDLLVTEVWITQADLDARPDLVKTLSVSPPRGQGRIRLVQFGSEDVIIDLQPCGGTHVARTAEIGALVVRKIENKGKQNRRVTVEFA